MRIATFWISCALTLLAGSASAQGIAEPKDWSPGIVKMLFTDTDAAIQQIKQNRSAKFGSPDLEGVIKGMVASLTAQGAGAVFDVEPLPPVNLGSNLQRIGHVVRFAEAPVFVDFSFYRTPNGRWIFFGANIQGENDKYPWGRR